MKKRIDVAPSTDPLKDLQSIIDYAKALQPYADLMHCDVMDGEFVKNKTFDHTFVKSINAQTLIPLDVHLMVEEPLDCLQNYISAGANIVTVHYEAFKDKKQLLEALKLIKDKGALCGISFKPATPIKDVKSYFFYVDVVLLMTVEPGKSGQGMLENSFDRLNEINKFRKDNNLGFKIEVDGGVNDTNAHLLAELGADILVSGNYIFSSPDREKAIKKLKK